MNIYYISAPHHHDIFTEGYIGITELNIEERLEQHKKKTKRKRNVCNN